MSLRRGLSFFCLALAACGSDEAPVVNAADVANVVENIAEVPDPAAKDDAPPPPALQPLAQSELAATIASGAGCDFSAGGEPLFVAAGPAGVAKVNGQVVRFAAEGPVGATGGFYTAGRLRISVGRTSEAGTAAGETTSWPGRLSLTDRSTDAHPLEVAGMWRCGA